jgi:hypothetical protein
VKKHSLPLAVIGALIFSVPSTAQIPGSAFETPVRSSVAGFSVGAYLNGTAATYEGDSTIESGAGLTLRLGYGFSTNFEVFAQMAGASLQHDGYTDRYGVGHFDMGVHYNFSQAASKNRPYVFGALSGRALTMEVVDLDLRGVAFTAGGGLRHFFNPALALDVNLGMTFGSLGEGRAGGGSWQDLGSDSIGMTTSRFNMGLSWHP